MLKLDVGGYQIQLSESGRIYTIQQNLSSGTSQHDTGDHLAPSMVLTLQIL